MRNPAALLAALTILAALTVLASCGLGSETPNAAPAEGDNDGAEADRETITVPLSLYIVVDEAGASELSSERTEEGLAEVALNMSEIWNQADIELEIVTIEELAMPSDVLAALAARDTEPFFAQAGRTFDINNPGVVNGFYVREAGGVNGFAPLSSRVFFVDDEPTVNDERVSSHEIGHLFGLHHDRQDAETLMFSGTNGTDLTPIEQQVARYAAQGVLNGQR